MPTQNEILLFVLLGPVGILITYLEYGLVRDVSNSPALTYYIASFIGTFFWATLLERLQHLGGGK